MATQDTIKEIDRELASIEREYVVADWDSVKVENMQPEEAYNRGYYRALQSAKNSLETDS